MTGSRRGFLKSLGALIGVAAVAPAVETPEIPEYTCGLVPCCTDLDGFYCAPMYMIDGQEVTREEWRQRMVRSLEALKDFKK